MIGQFAVCGEGLSNLFGLQPWYACVRKNGKIVIDELSDILLIIFPIVDSLIKIAAYVSAGFIFYMLFKIILARGDSGKIATAIGGIRDAVIGLVICMLSMAIVNFIVGSLT